MRVRAVDHRARVAKLQAVRKEASDRLGGRIGNLRREFRHRRATERDVALLAADHMAVMAAAAAVVGSSGRRACPHGLTEGSECFGCLMGESAETTASGRARRDVALAGGFGPMGSELDPARVRTAPVDPVRPFVKGLGSR